MVNIHHLLDSMEEVAEKPAVSKLTPGLALMKHNLVGRADAYGMIHSSVSVLEKRQR